MPSSRLVLYLSLKGMPVLSLWYLQGQTPLHVAAARSGCALHFQLVNVLMEYGADANATDAEVSSMT